MKTLGAFSLLLLATACAGVRAPAPEEARVAPPGQWRNAVPSPTSSVVRADWWTDFGDPVLDALVTHALGHSDDVAIAAARVAEARAQFRLVHAQQLPSVALAAAGDRERFVNAFGMPSYQTAGQVEFNASYDLDLFGRLANGTSAARASLLGSQASLETVRLAVIASTVSGYLTLRGLDSRLDVVEQTLAARSESLRVARRRAEAGYATALELRQAEAEFHATEQLVPAARLAIEKQEDGLSILVGDNPRSIERGTALSGFRPLGVPTTLPASLLRQRPDIAQAEQQIVAADRSLDAARAAFMPQIQLSSAGGAVASTLLGDPVGIFSLGGSVLAPLFEGGKLRAQADIATARRDQAAFAYRRTALSAFRDVEDALASIQRIDEQQKALIAQRDALDAALTLATKRYRAGYAPYLDQLDAQRGLLGAELSLVQSRSDALTAEVALYQSLGGGWTSASLDRMH